MPQTNQHKKVLTKNDERLIRECKDERRRLRKQASYLSDRALAAKFDCHYSTIRRV